MKLAEVFSQLAYGELSQLAIGKNSEGEIDENVYPIVVAHINLGLNALYRRFFLKEGRLTFPLTKDRNIYKLGVTDLNKIEQVLTDLNTSLSINNETDKYSCFTPSMDTLRVPQAIVDNGPDLEEKYRTENLLVVYRAKHPKIELVNGYINPEVVDLELPDSHLEALLYFVASRVNNPIGMVNEFNAGNNWASKYEMECQKLENYNLQIDTGTAHIRLSNNGWV